MNKKTWKVLGAGGLALFMGIGTLCGVLLAPMNSAQASVSSKETALTPQEQLLAGTLDLDPENDPVVFTTDYGLEIKWHMSELPKDPSKISTIQPTSSSGVYAYFSCGGYNWIIIGYSNKSKTISTGFLNMPEIVSYYDKVGYYNFSNLSTGIWGLLFNQTTTSAGQSILIDYLVAKGVIYNSSSNTISHKTIFPNAVSSAELEINEVLCLSETCVANSQFHTSRTQTISYNGSTLQTYINDTIYAANSEIRSLPIIAQDLTTAYTYYNSGKNYTSSFSISGAYLFPLAARDTNTETFCVQTYLTTPTNRIAYSMGTMTAVEWWTRSGYTVSGEAYRVNTAGNFAGNTNTTSNGVRDSRGVRPAFVLKI